VTVLTDVLATGPNVNVLSGMLDPIISISITLAITAYWP